jgi:7-carboxy-7-deazaguanine synthase
LIPARVVSATTEPSSKRIRATGPAARLKITETFVSIQGEADAVGWPTLFIRLTGCPLRCVYCDTEYAFYGGEWRTVGELIETARGSGVSRVCVTGGEPLAQKSCLDLLTALCNAGFAVSLETSGAMDVGDVDPRVSRVVDIKTPDSGESARNRMDNLGKLTGRDQVKIVICSRSDYEWARELLRVHAAALPCQVLFSPSFGQLEPRELAEWILADRLDVRLQVQLHKLLWGEAPGR